jgi:hypothetical protein
MATTSEQAESEEPAAEDELAPEPSDTPAAKTPRSRGSVKRGASTATPKGTESALSVKRRKLEEKLSSGPRSTRSQRSQRMDIYELEEEDPLANPRSPNGPTTPPRAAKLQPTSEPSQARTSHTKRKRDERSRPAEEISESPKDAPGSGYRMSPNAEAQRTRSAIKAHMSVRRSPRSPPAQPSNRKLRARKSPASPEIGSQSTRMFVTPTGSKEVVENEEEDELSPEQSTLSHGSRKSEKSLDVDEEASNQEEAEEISDSTAAVRLNNARRRRTRNHQPESAEEDELEAEPEEEEPPPKSKSSKLGGKRLRPPASPALPSQPSRKSLSVSASQSSRPTQSQTIDTGKSRKKPKKSKVHPEDLSTKKKERGTVPVTVHRFTKALVYNEDETDADILNTDIPHAKRSGVNTVDVLAQICEEVLSSAIGTLEDGGQAAENAALRREYRIKLRAIEAFQEELRARLLELVSQSTSNEATQLKDSRLSDWTIAMLWLNG